MYGIGEKIVYGNSGVCEVESYTAPKLPGINKEQRYYALRPLYQSGTIYCPADNPKVFMRPVITRQEAEALIDLIPAIEAEPCPSNQMQEISEHYKSAINTHDCADLIELIMSIYCKKQAVEAKKRKFSQLDGRYMKLAEDLLYGEFAVALEMPKDSVKAYISKRVDEAEKAAAAAN